MNYFITGSVDYWTSAIEISEVQRLKIFDRLHQPAVIVETKYNEDHERAHKKFNIQNRVINMFEFFQQLPFLNKPNNQEIISRILNQDRYADDTNIAISKEGLMINGQLRIRLNYDPDGKWLTYVEQFDKYSRPSSTSFYDHGFKSYTNFYDDNGHQMIRQYFNAMGFPIITYYYHWNTESKTNAIFNINYIDNYGMTHIFDREEEFRAYFFDQLIKHDPYPVLISDRSDQALEAFKMMKYQAPRFQYFHAAFTFTGEPKPVDDDDKVDLYEMLPDMYKTGAISGIISSTKREAREAGQYYHVHSYALPVFATSQKIMNNQVDFSHRKKGRIIAIARQDQVKQLDHIINAVIQLKPTHPEISLRIYGYKNSDNNYETPRLLEKLIKENHAEDYIKIHEYKQNLNDVYNSAQIEILTSKTEGFAIALQEAQEHGCPVISYDISYGPSEIIENGKTGLLIAKNDHKALVGSIDNLLSHQEILKEFSKNAPDAVRKYSFENLTRRWKRFLKKENIFLTPEMQSQN